MKKYFLLLVASACISVAEAQLVKQNGQGEKKQSDLATMFRGGRHISC